MESEPKDLIVLGAIKHGAKKFEKIQKMTQIEPEELNSILEQLEKRGFIQTEEKKGLFGMKIEIKPTEKGSKGFTSCKQNGARCHYCTNQETKRN